MTDTGDDEFDALIESAYAESEVVSGTFGEDRMTPVMPTPARPGVDRGVAGSLVQARVELRRDRRRQTGPPWRDAWSVVPGALLAAGVVAVVWIVLAPLSPWSALVIPVGTVMAVAGWVLYVRRGPVVGERALTELIGVEQRVGRQLQASLAGSAWVLLHDRMLPGSEHRVPFVAVGPSGVVLVAVLPAGPYLVLTPSGVRAGEDELGGGWLPARLWEVRYLLRQLMAEPARDLRFLGPVMGLAAIGFDRATTVPTGWSVEPPHRIDDYPIRTPAALGQYLRYLPVTLGSGHLDQLIRLVDRSCPPAPRPG